jgi:hypothetical protein
MDESKDITDEKLLLVQKLMSPSKKKFRDELTSTNVIEN